MNRKTYKEILDGFKHHDPRGSDIYVVRSIQGLVEPNEIVDNSINDLRETIKKYNTTGEKQTGNMILLTRCIAVLTSLMFIGLCIQIWLSF